MALLVRRTRGLSGPWAASGLLAVCAMAAACGNGEVGQARFELLSYPAGGEPRSDEVSSWTHRVEDGPGPGEGGVHYYSEFQLAGGQLGQLDIELATPGIDVAPRLHYREQGGDGRVLFDSRAVEAHLVTQVPTEICACADLRFDARFIDPGPDDALGTGDDDAREMLGGQLHFDSECVLPSPASSDGGVEVQYRGSCPDDTAYPSASSASGASGAQGLDAPPPTHEVIVVVHEQPPPVLVDASGCSAGEDESSGCQSTGGEESSGCEGDSGGGRETGGESSGCEGDTVDDGTDSSGCEDDGLSRAASPRSAARHACVAPSPSPWSGPLQNYLMIALSVLWQVRRRAQLR